MARISFFNVHRTFEPAVEIANAGRMKVSRPSASGFIWPSLTLLFSLLASAGCVVALAHALLAVVEF